MLIMLIILILKWGWEIFAFSRLKPFSFVILDGVRLRDCRTILGPIQRRESAHDEKTYG